MSYLLNLLQLFLEKLECAEPSSEILERHRSDLLEVAVYILQSLLDEAQACDPAGVQFLAKVAAVDRLIIQVSVNQ